MVLEVYLILVIILAFQDLWSNITISVVIFFIFQDLSVDFDMLHPIVLEVVIFFTFQDLLNVFVCYHVVCINYTAIVLFCFHFAATM